MDRTRANEHGKPLQNPPLTSSLSVPTESGRSKSLQGNHTWLRIALYEGQLMVRYQIIRMKRDVWDRSGQDNVREDEKGRRLEGR